MSYSPEEHEFHYEDQLEFDLRSSLQEVLAVDVWNDVTDGNIYVLHGDRSLKLYVAAGSVECVEFGIHTFDKAEECEAFEGYEILFPSVDVKSANRKANRRPQSAQVTLRCRDGSDLMESHLDAALISSIQAHIAQGATLMLQPDRKGARMLRRKERSERSRELREQRVQKVAAGMRLFVAGLLKGNSVFKPWFRRTSRHESE